MVNRRILAILGFSVTSFALLTIGCAPEKDTKTQINRGSGAGAMGSAGALNSAQSKAQLRTAGMSTVKSKVSVTSTKMAQADRDAMFSQIIDPSLAESAQIQDVESGSYTTVEAAVRLASKEDQSLLYMTINSGQLGAQFNYVDNKASFLIDQMRILTGLTVNENKSVQSVELGLQLNVKADADGTNTTDLNGPINLKVRNVFAQLLNTSHFSTAEKIYKLTLKEEKLLITARVKIDGSDLKILVDFTNAKKEVLVMAIRLQKTDKPAAPILNLSDVQTTSL